MHAKATGAMLVLTLTLGAGVLLCDYGSPALRRAHGAPTDSAAAADSAATESAAADSATTSSEAASATTAAEKPSAEKPASSAAVTTVGSTPGRSGSAATIIPDPSHAGGESESVVQVANLVYSETMSSRCFSDHFLIKAEEESAISTSRRFHAVKLSSSELFEFPLVVMTGEGSFRLTDAERENMRRYVERGGLLLASAGCSSPDWDRDFRREMATIFPEHPMGELGMDHPLFHTVYDIHELKTRHDTPRALSGISIGGRVGVVYSPDGLNDTPHTEGCCCCGGNEIVNAIDINVNVLAYALTH